MALAGKMGDIIAGKNIPLGITGQAKACDGCKVTAAALFCRTDSSYMCIICDTKIHGDDRYERVWMCEVCEHAPSSVTCKADAAALCVMCDWDIHSANPLARRHERIPVTPFYHSTVKSTAAPLIEAVVAPESDPNIITYEKCNKSTCHEESTNNNCWLPANNSKLSADIQADMKSIEFLFSDPDNLLDFDYPVPNDPPNLYGGDTIGADTIGADSVVPVQIHIKPPSKSSSVVGQSVDNHFEIDFTTSNISSFNTTSFTAQSMSQNIASDVAIVPEGSGISDTSYPYTLQMNNNVNNNNNNNNNGGSSGQVVSVAMDREARVMRYREKRKNRKFEKTIRYASRKAYAETRPRIKGRFAKRSENIEADVDNWFTSSPVTTNFIGNSGFGVVPTF